MDETATIASFLLLKESEKIVVSTSTGTDIIGSMEIESVNNLENNLEGGLEGREGRGRKDEEEGDGDNEGDGEGEKRSRRRGDEDDMAGTDEMIEVL